MGIVVWVLYAFRQYKKFEDWLRFDKVTESLKVGTFFETQCIRYSVVCYYSRQHCTRPVWGRRFGQLSKAPKCKLIYMQGGPKTGLFLEVCNSRIC